MNTTIEKAHAMVNLKCTCYKKNLSIASIPILLLFRSNSLLEIQIMEIN